MIVPLSCVTGLYVACVISVMALYSIHPIQDVWKTNIHTSNGTTHTVTESYDDDVATEALQMICISLAAVALMSFGTLVAEHKKAQQNMISYRSPAMVLVALCVLLVLPLAIIPFTLPGYEHVDYVAPFPQTYFNKSLFYGEQAEQYSDWCYTVQLQAQAQAQAQAQNVSKVCYLNTTHEDLTLTGKPVLYSSLIGLFTLYIPLVVIGFFLVRRQQGRGRYSIIN